MTSLLIFKRWVWPVLTFGITLPLWAFLLAGTWLWYDKNSSVRQAVNSAVKELVAGAELAAAESRNEALRRINLELERKAFQYKTANDIFSDQLQEAQLKLDDANDQISELLSQPVNSECVVDGPLLDRLRN